MSNILVCGDISFERSSISSSQITYHKGKFVGIIQKGKFVPNATLELTQEVLDSILAAAKSFLLIR